MHTKTMKCFSIAALLLAMAFWPASSGYQTELNWIVSAAAIVIGIQACRTGDYLWSTGFLALAVLFNPVFPLFRLSGMLGLALVVLGIAPFAVSLAALRPAMLLSNSSVTDRTPGRRSS